MCPAVERRESEGHERDVAEQRERRQRRELRRWAIEQAIAVGASSSTLEMVADMIVNYVREDEGGTTNG